MRKIRCVLSHFCGGAGVTVATGISLDDLVEPLALSLVQKEEVEEESKPIRRKSEVLDKDDMEDHTEIVYQIADSEDRVFTSNMVDMGRKYFAFVCAGESIVAVPINQWLRFSQTLAYNNILPDIPIARSKVQQEVEHDEVEEVDYEDKFDDDNSEDDIRESVEIKLSRSGRKMHNLVKSFECDDDDENVEEEVGCTDMTNFKAIRDAVGGDSITIKELLRRLGIKTNKIDQRTKEEIRTFIKMECNVTEGQGGRVISLRK